MDTLQYANYSVRKLQVVRISRHAGDRRNSATITNKATDTETSRAEDNTTEPEKRIVFQYHFEEWPDFGTPNDRSSVISFILRCREHEESHPGPPIVHCRLVKKSSM